jgi:hypothetical protein
VIDASPHNFFVPDAFDRIHLAYGSQPLKLVVILREPVERALSEFRMDKFEDLKRLKMVNLLWSSTLL